MSYNIFRNFGYLLEPVLSDLVETEKHVNSFVATVLSIYSYLVLPVSTPFEPPTICCCVHSLFGYFGYKRQSAQPPLVFSTGTLTKDYGAVHLEAA